MAEVAKNLDARHWQTIDGRYHTSIPVERDDIPNVYEIKSIPYGKTGKTYIVYRDDVELPLSHYGRRKDAFERIMRNSAGMDTVNVA